MRGVPARGISSLGAKGDRLWNFHFVATSSVVGGSSSKGLPHTSGLTHLVQAPGGSAEAAWWVGPHREARGVYHAAFSAFHGLRGPQQLRGSPPRADDPAQEPLGSKHLARRVKTKGKLV